MRRTLCLLALGVVATGCPYDPKVIDPTEITTNDTDGTTATDSLTDATEASDPTTTPTTTVDPDTTDTSEAVCGDGEVNGDEVCDDGTNDGSYGSCVSDCSAFAERCGDGEVNGPETCDDGTNDGSYGGCAEACDALGPHCGDGDVNGPEGCDEGEGNVDGTGCNHDCVVSGTQLGSYDVGPADFCDGVFVTRPAFRDNGTTVVAATGYCAEDSTLLVELDADVAETQRFDDLLLPELPIYQATAVEDAWVLSAQGCNYVVTAAGVLNEVCGGGRTVGVASLEAADDGSYVALDYDVLTIYPSGSPMPGDAPTWLAMPQDNATYDYAFGAATFAENGSVAVVGSRRTISNGTYVGYVGRYTAAGNLAGNFTFGSVEYFQDVVHAPDGTVLAVTGYPAYSVTKLDANFVEEWTFATGADTDIAAAYDSTGALVLLFRDQATQDYRLLKRASDGATLWDRTVDNLGYEFRVTIDESDAIWIADAPYQADGFHLVVQKFAP